MSRSFLFVWMDSFDLNQFFTNKLKIKTSVGDVCLTHPQVDSQVGNVFAAFHVKVVVVLFLLRIVCVEPQINNWTKPMCCLPALICDV